MRRYKLAIGLSCLIVSVAVMGDLLWYCFVRRSPPPSNPAPYVRVEFKAATDEAEKTRTLKFIDERLRQVDIRFADGSFGHRFLEVGTDGKSRLRSADEFHDDKSWFAFTFDDKGKLAVVFGYRPDGSKSVKEVTLPDGRTLRTFFGADGEAQVATLLLGEADYVFTAYEGAAGHERKLYVEEYSEPKTPGRWEGSTPSYIITRTVFDDGISPAFRQVWSGWNYENEGGSSGGGLGNKNGNGNGQGNFSLTALEFFHEDTLLVRERVLFGQSFDLSGQQETDGFAVYVLDTSGKETSVRYLTKDYKVVKTVDKSKTPEVTIVTPKAEAPTETIDAQKMISPVSEAMSKLRDETIMTGIGYLHIDRLLVD